VFAAVARGNEFPARVNADFGGAVPHTIEIASESLEIRSKFRVWLEEAGLRIEGTTDWRTNRVAISATFGRRGDLPDTASIKTENFAIPGELLKLEGYRTVEGDVEANWTNGAFNLKLQADATPADKTTNYPAARVELKARGDTNSATIDSATISSPWLKAKLTENVAVYFSGPLVREPAHLAVEADLDRQPWGKLRGMLAGEIELSPTDAVYPVADFVLRGTNVGSPSLTAINLRLAGRLNWPWLSLTNATADFEDASVLSLNGGFHWLSRELSGARLVLNGPLARRWLPAGYSLDGLNLQVEASGPITNLTHHGRVVATNFANERTRPLQLEANWEGTNLNFSKTVLSIVSGADSLAAQFSTLVEPGQFSQLAHARHAEIELQQLTLRTNGDVALSLGQSAVVTAERVADKTNIWELHVANFDWQGPAGGLALEADVQWPERAHVTFFVTNLQSSLLARFVPVPPDAVQLNQFHLQGGWTNGPVAFALRADGVVIPAAFGGVGTGADTNSATSGQSRPAGTLAQSPVGPSASSNELLRPLAVQIEAAGNSDGLAISNVTVTSEKSPVTTVRGLLPVTFNPSTPSDAIQIDTKKPLELKLATSPESVFWERLTDWTGVVLREPDFKADISGTWAAPQGTVRLRAAQVKLRKPAAKLPDMEKLEVDLGLTRGAAVLTNLSVLVQGQKVSANGEVPLGEKFWTEWKQQRTPNWDQARGHLEIQHANIAAFAEWFPTVLSPQGEFDLNVALQPGLNLTGELAVLHARTLPLPGIGPIRDIDVRMLYLKRRAKLRSATASIGGSTVTAAGEGDLSGTDWLKGVPPPFEFVLMGTNVPLSRQPESIVRSDLNLTIRKTNGAATLVSGTARLHDSYYLSDLADLVPGKTASAERRPPYFSVEESGLADWRLGVRVTGDNALKVRTTLFTGVVSPNLRLQGTLKEPVALGDVRIESGLVRFPFANLDVQQGLVTLGSEDPYRPRLLVKAGSKQFGYEVRMEMSGPADDPVIQFSSTPPLSSEQLVLMLTAGELPRGGYNLTPQQRAETMALFLGKDMLAKLGFGDTSKERLTFSSGQEISEEGKPTYTLEYKLTDRWSLVGEYDRFNAFNAGVKWKVYSR
jgi:translocation and assembly module TamB